MCRRIAALAVGLVSLSAGAQPVAHPFPSGIEAVRILDGTARLSLDTPEPRQSLVLLPAGVFFTETGYATLLSTTERLQDTVTRLTETQTSCTQPPVTITPPPDVQVTTGWSNTALVVVGILAFGVGASATALVLR